MCHWGPMLIFLLITCNCQSEIYTNGRLCETEMRQISMETFIWGYPMIMNYKTMWSLLQSDLADNQNPFNKFNHFRSTTGTGFKVVVTPNVDTPYSMATLDLRSQPVVICVPRIKPANRYYSIQLVDMYTFNIGYIGTRATGNHAGCYMIRHVNNQPWVPWLNLNQIPGIKKIFSTETQFVLALVRTQLYNDSDLANVHRIQDMYNIYRLSEFLRIDPPYCADSPLQFPEYIEKEALGTKFPNYLSFLLQFATPTNAQDNNIRYLASKIGIEPGKQFSYKWLDPVYKKNISYGTKQGYQLISSSNKFEGTLRNGWATAEGFGDRNFINGDWLKRASSAFIGLYGLDQVEAVYLSALKSSDGRTLNGENVYTLTFDQREWPPATKFWSITMYDIKTKQLVENSLGRYSINSGMIETFVKGPDGSTTIYIQHQSPSLDTNWLPAPEADFYIMLRMYSPMEAFLNGTWNPPSVVFQKHLIDVLRFL